MYKAKKIYYLKTTGEVLWAAAYSYPVEVNFDTDYESVLSLRERERDSIGAFTRKRKT